MPPVILSNHPLQVVRFHTKREKMTRAQRERIEGRIREDAGGTLLTEMSMMRALQDSQQALMHFGYDSQLYLARRCHASGKNSRGERLLTFARSRKYRPDLDPDIVRLQKLENKIVLAVQVIQNILADPFGD